MSKRKGAFLAAAPITALLVLAAGARFLPSVLQKSAPDDDKAVLLSGSPFQSGRPHVKPKPIPDKPADAKTQAALTKVVSGQLDAFARNDFAAALRYSGPEFRANISPDAFHAIVEKGYSGLIHSKAARFKNARCSADRAVLPVTVTAVTGMEMDYMYILRRGTKKTDAEIADWYVEGVSPLLPKISPGADGPGSRHMTDVQEL